MIDDLGMGHRQRVKSTLIIIIIIIIKDIWYSASSQGPQMRYVGRDGSMVT